MCTRYLCRFSLIRERDSRARERDRLTLARTPPPRRIPQAKTTRYATARTWRVLHRSSWLSVLLPTARASARRAASLWNINMTRNIISHDRRRRGNTKYYPVEAPTLAGRFYYSRRRRRRPYFAPGSSPQDTRPRDAADKLAPRVTTPLGRRDVAQKGCTRAYVRVPAYVCTSSSAGGNGELAIERSQLPRNRSVGRTRFLRSSFAAGVIYRPYFPARTEGAKSAGRRILRLFLRPPYRALASSSSCYARRRGLVQIRYFARRWAAHQLLKRTYCSP